MQTLADSSRVSELICGLHDTLKSWIEAGDDSAEWALVGIRSRGDEIARRLAAALPEAAARRIADRVGTLDITLYRDDLSEIGAQPMVRTTEVPFAIDGRSVVLIDDVVMSGRSIRAALQSLMDLGRPRRVWLMVLVDRGGRELPIAPDAVGLDLSDVAADQHVAVRLTPEDDEDAIVVEPRSAEVRP